MDPKDYTNWSRLDPDDAAAQVGEKILTATKVGSHRHVSAARGARIYERYHRSGLFDSVQYNDIIGRQHDNTDRNSWNYGKSIVDTIAAKVMGLDNPKCQMVTTDASWEEKRDAVWADRFIEGQAHESQGNFSNLWELGRAGATMAMAATGMAGIRTEPDFVFKRVSHTLRSTLSTFIDHQDIHHGRPMTYFDVTWESPEILAEDPRWPQHKDHILKSADPVPSWMRHEGEVDLNTPMVEVVTAWRMPFGSFKGREARFVGGKAIQWDDYEFDKPRISFFRAGKLLGDSFHSASIIDDILGPLRIIDKVVSRTNNVLDKLSDVTIAVDTNAIPEKGMGDAKDLKILKYNGEKGGVPQVISMPVMDQSRLNYLERNIQAVHELSGVDQMHTAGKRPEGMTSGRGVRMVASLFSERHSMLQRRWRNWIAVDVAEATIAAAAEIGQHEPDWQQSWAGEDFEANISVDAINAILEQKYTMRPYVVAEQKNTPGDRAELANEMLANGQISPESHAEIVSGTFDTKSETKAESAQRRFYAKLIDLALHATQEEVEDPDFWGQKYQNSPPWVDAPSAMRQLFGAYWETLIDDVPQYRREILKRALAELDFMVKQAAQSAAAAEGLSVSVNAPSVEEALGGAQPPAGVANEQQQQGALSPGDGLSIG